MSVVQFRACLFLKPMPSNLNRFAKQKFENPNHLNLLAPETSALTPSNPETFRKAPGSTPLRRNPSSNTGPPNADLPSFSGFLVSRLGFKDQRLAGLQGYRVSGVEGLGGSGWLAPGRWVLQAGLLDLKLRSGISPGRPRLKLR